MAVYLEKGSQLQASTCTSATSVKASMLGIYDRCPERFSGPALAVAINVVGDSDGCSQISFGALESQTYYLKLQSVSAPSPAVIEYTGSYDYNTELTTAPTVAAITASFESGFDG
jgi:hypothetical protein